MSSETQPPDYVALRARAVSRIDGPERSLRPGSTIAGALQVLYELAGSSATAGQAMALLHELQVNQVELDMQAEELQRTQLEMQMLLARQIQLYEWAPVGYITIERDTVLREVNRAAERIFDLPRADILGRPLSSFLLPQSQWVLQGMLRPLLHGTIHDSSHGMLAIASFGLEAQSVRAIATRDPEGDRFLLILSEGPVEMDAGARLKP